MTWHLKQSAHRSHDWHRSLLAHAPDWHPPSVHPGHPQDAVTHENISASRLDPRMTDQAIHMLTRLGFRMSGE